MRCSTGLLKVEPTVAMIAIGSSWFGLQLPCLHPTFASLLLTGRNITSRRHTTVSKLS